MTTKKTCNAIKSGYDEVIDFCRKGIDAKEMKEFCEFIASDVVINQIYGMMTPLKNNPFVKDKNCVITFENASSYFEGYLNSLK